ncbi:restriction endonuclease subunit S [Streptomyces sp. NPDC059373]
MIRLQNVGDGIFRDERAYISLDHFETLRNHEVVPGDLIIASLGESLPRVTIVPEMRSPAIVKADVIRARIHESVSTKWVMYALMSPYVRNHTASRIKGVGRPRLGLGEIRKLPVPMPPLAEQRRLVEVLEAHFSHLDAGISTLNLVRAKSERLKSVVNGEALAGRFSRPVRADETVRRKTVQQASNSLAARRWKPTEPVIIPGYKPPKNWTTVSLGDLSYESGYGTSTKCAYEAPGYPVLRIPNVQGGSINLSDIKNAVDPTVDLTKFNLEPGDLLFVRTNGSPRLIGRVGVVEENLPYAFASYLIRFRLTPGIVKPRWVQLVMQSPLWRRAIERYAASSAGQYNLSAETLSQLPVPVPPLEVQCETLDAVDAAAARALRLSVATNVALARADHLRSALMSRAFTGQLVPQDPADEPASIALDRIRAERAAQGAKPKQARRPQKTTPPPPTTTGTPIPTTAVQQELPL